MNKQQLASKIWASANKMRSKIEANEYKDYILGFIFYKFLSDKEEELLRKDEWSAEDIKNELNEENKEDKAYIQRKLGYFIAYKNLFSTWISPSNTFNSSDVTDALLAFERNVHPTHKKVFDKIFNTLQTGLSKLGDTSGARTKAILDLLKLIKDIPTDDSQDYDVLGFIYEYLIGNFAAHAGKKAGEFYTPHEVALLMAEIVANHLKGRENIEIYDPTSGSGSLLINIGKAAAKHLRKRDSIKYYAQELKENTYNLTRMNLIMRGIKPENIQVRCGDTLDKDWPWFDDNDPLRTYNPLYVDAVVSNPPYSQQWDNRDKDSEARYKEYGVAPKGKADYAFLLHDLFHVKPQGIMTIVLPHGVLFRGKEEGNIRRNLIEKNNIDAIIGLPANIFFGTPINTIIMVLRQKRERDDILFIDASRLSIKVGKQNKLTASDIKLIADTYIERNPSDPTFARVVSRDEVRNNDYNLNIPRYIKSADIPVPWDAHSIIFGGLPKSEIDALAPFWSAFPSLRESIFCSTETPYTRIKVDDIDKCISDNIDVKKWKDTYASVLAPLPSDLHSRLIDRIMTVNKDQEESVIASSLFEKLSTIPLVDKYLAFQILDNNYRQIATDLEIIQTEGFDATRIIEDHLVIKKKGDEEVEVPDGKQGHVLPFQLVQRILLSSEYDALMAATELALSKEAELEEACQRIDQDDYQEDFYDFDKEAFIVKGVASKVKEIRKELNNSAPESGSFEEALLAFYDRGEELKAAKKAVKTLSSDILEKTMTLIPNLSDDDVKRLLHEKWITPLCEELSKISVTILSGLSASIKRLDKKYLRTLQDIEQEKAAVEERLSLLLGNLTGNEDDMTAFEQMRTIIGGPALKACCLSRMFPDGDNDEPKIRIKGFSGNWKRRKLEEYLSIREDTAGDDYTKEDVLSVSGDYGVVNQIEFQGRSFAGASISNYRVVNKGNVVYTKSPLKASPYGIIKTAKKEEGIVSPLYAVYDPKENCDPDFVQTYFESRDRLNLYLRPLVNKGAKNTLLISDEGALQGEVVFPKKDEQVAISAFFTELDGLLSLIEEELGKFKFLKQSCLQGLYV